MMPSSLSALSRPFVLALILMCAGLSGGFPCYTASAGSLEELDQIVSQAKDLDDFLRNPQLIETYFAALQEYYGPDRFPRESFNAVLGQLRVSAQKVPELKTRLWETSHLGQPFSIKTSLKSRGRGISESVWGLSQKIWRLTLQEQMKNMSSEQALSVLQAFNQEASKINALNEQPASKAKKLRDLYRAATQPGEVKQALAVYLKETVSSEAVQDTLRSGEPDLILDLMESLRRGPFGKGSPSAFEQNIAPEVLNLARFQVLPEEDFIRAFPLKTIASARGKEVPLGAAQSIYEFRSVPRRIHGIWKGIARRECVGGDCANLSSLTPERWAVIALKDTQLYSIESGNHYYGFVQVVPVEVDRGFGKETYGSVDFGSSELLKDAGYIDLPSGKRRSVKFYDRWLTEALKQKPAHWKGYVVGQSKAVNNAGVLDLVHTTATHKLIPPVAAASAFSQPDPLAQKIVEAAQPNRGPLAIKYGGNMIYDAAMSDTVELKRLLPMDIDLTDSKTLVTLLAGKNERIKKYVRQQITPQDYGNTYYEGTLRQEKEVIPLLKRLGAQPDSVANFVKLLANSDVDTALTAEAVLGWFISERYHPARNGLAHRDESSIQALVGIAENPSAPIEERRQAARFLLSFVSEKPWVLETSQTDAFFETLRQSADPALKSVGDLHKASDAELLEQFARFETTTLDGSSPSWRRYFIKRFERIQGETLLKNSEVLPTKELKALARETIDRFYAQLLKSEPDHRLRRKVLEGALNFEEKGWRESVFFPKKFGKIFRDQTIETFKKDSNLWVKSEAYRYIQNHVGYVHKLGKNLGESTSYFKDRELELWRNLLTIENTAADHGDWQPQWVLNAKKSFEKNVRPTDKEILEHLREYSQKSSSPYTREYFGKVLVELEKRAGESQSGFKVCLARYLQKLNLKKASD